MWIFLVSKTVHSRKIYLDCNYRCMVSVSPFDENLLTHINRELADYVGRESDTS
jgi:hypothetical protein